MEKLLYDLRYGARMLSRRPGFTLIAIITLALGIGANTAIFSVVNSVLLSPLPYKEPDRLIRVYEKRLALGRTRNVASAPDFLDWRAQNQVFENMAAWTGWGANLSTGTGEPVRVIGAAITADLFPTLGVEPQLGRTFSQEEDSPASKGPVVIISHGLWQRYLGGDREIIDKTISLNGRAVTVVGVMPQGFGFPHAESDVWAPIGLNPADQGNRGSHFLDVLARLKPGVTIEQAQTEMNAIGARLEEQYQVNTGHGVNLFSFHDETVGNIRPALVVLLAAVGFVLLIACANVANLLLARAATRHKEVAIRAALGANRARMIRQLLTESLLLAVVGGAIGLFVAAWGIDALVRISPEDTPRLNEIGMDGRVFLFTFAVTMFTGVLFGLIPAIQATKPDFTGSLKEGGRTSAGGATRNRARSILVIAEVALSLILLIGAGLMIKSFTQLSSVGPGFNPENVLTMQVNLPSLKYREGHQQTAFTKQMLERLEEIPGVESAGATVVLPLAGVYGSRYFSIEGGPPTAPGQGNNANFNLASPGFFRTLGIPLLAGRDFTAQDVQGAPEVVIINEQMARQFWPDEDALGKRITVGNNPWRTIIGIVGDVRQSKLDTEPRQEMYYPLLQSPSRDLTLAVRTSGDPENFLSAVRGQLQLLDKDQPLFAIRTMNDLIAESVAPQRLNMLLMMTFAIVAIVLAMVGIYGVISYSVTQRTHEIGVRMALGAQPGDVVKMVLRHGMGLSVAGVVIGAGTALLLTRWMSSLLFKVSAYDPVTFITLSLLLIAVAFLACYIPARRATKVDPMVALHYE